MPTWLQENIFLASLLEIFGVPWDLSYLIIEYAKQHMHIFLQFDML